MMKVIAWCLTNIKTALLIMSAIAGFVYPFAKESIAFVHMGYETRKASRINSSRIMKLEEYKTADEERSSLMFTMLKEIRDRDYEELKEARKKR